MGASRGLRPRELSAIGHQKLKANRLMARADGWWL